MTFAHHYDNHHLPLHLRIALYAADHHGVHLDRGQLRAAIDPLTRPAEIARAVRHAIKAGLLAPGSTSRCLRSLLTSEDAKGVRHADTLDGAKGTQNLQTLDDDRRTA